MVSPTRLDPRERGRVAALALGVAWLGACTEPPSYQLSWTFYDAAQAVGDGEDLTRVIQCAELGVSKVRITTLSGGDDLCSGVIVDEREFPCAKVDLLSGEVVDGPALDPGEYTVLVQGLRRGGEPWHCGIDDVDNGCVPDGETCFARVLTKHSCSASSECGEDRYCVEGTCTVPGAKCTINGDDNGGCVEGLVCCEAPDCLPSGELPPAPTQAELAEDDSLEQELGVCVWVEDPARFIPDIVVTEGQAVLLGDPIELLAPPQCDDGIDNDRDGRVDDNDPACLLPAAVNPEGLEGAEKGLTIFQLSARFLTYEIIEPVNVSVDKILLVAQNRDVADDTHEFVVNAAGEQGLDLSQWPFRLPLLSDGFDAGTYELTATALDQDGAALTQPVPRVFNEVEETDFSIIDDEPAFVRGEFQFTSDTFLEPIVSPISFDPQLATATVQASCELGGAVAGVQPRIERMWVRVSDELDMSVDPGTLGLAVLDPIDEGDGFVSFACPTITVSSAPQTWGGYTIELEARIGDEVCFATSAQALAPYPGGGAQVIELQRAEPPPPNCIECEKDTDCLDPNLTFCSDEGLCLLRGTNGG